MSNETKKQRDELLAEAVSKDKTIEALRGQVDYWKSLFNSLARDNEECDAELMKEEPWTP
jgi:predicted  nucleic acid-binding Zn-ribbon protein